MTLFIDVSASRWKPSSGLTSGTSCQYLKACPIRGFIGSSPHLEPHTGQAFTYWRPVPEVCPDKGFRREAETSINSMLFELY